MPDEAPRPPAARRRPRRALTAAECLVEDLEESFEPMRVTGSPESIRAWSAGVAAFTRRRALARSGPGAIEALRRAAGLLKFQLARLPPGLLRGRANLVSLLCRFARSLEELQDPGLTRRSQGFLAMLAGRLGVRGWNGRRDATFLAASDTWFQKLIRRPDPETLDAWLLLVQAAVAPPATLCEERDFYRDYAGKLVAYARVVPADWLDPAKLLGSCLARLAERLVRCKDPALTELGCEIAAVVAERRQDPARPGTSPSGE